MLDLLVVLQSHSRSNNQKQITRYMSDDKAEISYRCIKSLVNSLNHVIKEKPNEIKVKLQVLDDHSDDFFLNRLDSILKKCDFDYELQHLDSYGIMPSILACYEYGKDKGKDLVYFAQDDYLYYESCIFEMVDAYFRFSEKSKLPVCIYPFDDPYRYGIPPERQPMVTVHLGLKRHWKTSFGTASCFMLDHSTLVKNFDLFDAMGNHAIDNVMEDETLNKLFRDRGCLLFTPIPSLALHAQADTEKDPYLNWRELWDQFAEEDKKYTHLFDSNQKIILNVGAGSTSVHKQTDFFKNFKELKLDVAEVNPDIISDITALEGVPDDSVDAIWACHVVEHVYFHKLPDVFKNMIRVIKPDGYAIIRVPDIASIAHMIENDLFTPVYDTNVGPICPIDILYSSRVLVERYGEPMCHRTGFTIKSMTEILQNLGINALVAGINGEVVTILYKSKEPPNVINDPNFKW
jgi:hypothetical protein